MLEFTSFVVFLPLESLDSTLNVKPLPLFVTILCIALFFLS